MLIPYNGATELIKGSATVVPEQTIVSVCLAQQENLPAVDSSIPD